MFRNYFTYKSRGSLPIFITIIVVAILGIIIMIAGIAMMNELTGNNSGAPQSNSLCASVPEPYNNIFKNAGDKWKVQPAFIAAIFYGGEHANSWPSSNGPWASSPKGAQGPFQFMPATWSSNKQDGDGDGKMEVQNLTDSAFGAAHLLANIGAGGNTQDLDSLRDAASKYNSGRPWSKGQGIPETAKYVPRVIDAYQKFLCKTTATGKWIWPVDSNSRITSPFGETGPSHPRPHSGLDLAIPNGTQIKAVDSGTVSKVNNNKNDICGVYVKLDHQNGLQSVYCHLTVGGARVTEGQMVNQGQLIGISDNTGHSTGPHLHLGAILNGTYVNPRNYLPPR